MRLLLALVAGCSGFTFEVQVAEVDPSVTSVRADADEVSLRDGLATIDFDFSSYADADEAADAEIDFVTADGTTVTRGSVHVGWCALSGLHEIEFEQDRYDFNVSFDAGLAGFSCRGDGRTIVAVERTR